MEPQWYWRRQGGHEHGPVTTALLEALIRFNNIGDTDEVRLETNGAWTKVSGVRELFASLEKPAGIDSTPHASARSLDEAEVASLNPRGDESDRTSLIQWVLEFCESCVSGFGAMCGGLLSAILERLLYLLKILRTKVSLFVIAVLLLGVFVKDFARQKSQNQTALKMMTQIWEEMDLLLGHNASGADWSDFQQRAMVTLSPSLEQLEETARNNPRDPSFYWTDSGFDDAMIRSELIQAGTTLRDLLRSQGGDEQMQSLFHKKINLVQLQLTTGSRTNVFGDRIDRVPSEPWDVFSMGMIVMDVLIVGSVLVWWRRASTKQGPEEVMKV